MVIYVNGSMNVRRERDAMTKGTIQNSETFLNHIADRIGGKRRRKVNRPERAHRPELDVYKDKSIDELTAIFTKNSEEKGTHVIETTLKNLSETVKEVMKEYDGSPMISAQDERFDKFGLTDLFKKENVYTWNADAGKKNIEEAEKANIGFIFSDVSLAESGTVTQFNDRDNARSVSLLPITYVAIVPKTTIVARMTQANARIHKEVSEGEDISPYINFISGPSNSADIEMNIVTGVHGPVKAVHIVVTDA